MRQYKREEYVREDGKIVIIERCTNPHWDAMPGEFDKVFLYDPVLAKKKWGKRYTFKTKDGRRECIWLFTGIGLIIAGVIGMILTTKALGDFSPPAPAWAYAGVTTFVAGLVLMIGRDAYVTMKRFSMKCLQCPFPEDPGAF